MSQFILLLHHSPEQWQGVSAEEVQAVIAEYSAWRDKLEQDGRLIGSEKLIDDTAKMLTAPNGSVVVDGPFAEAKEIIGGFFMIEAADWDEAVAVSKECPHLKYQGRIELRQIDALHDAEA